MTARAHHQEKGTCFFQRVLPTTNSGRASNAPPKSLSPLAQGFTLETSLFWESCLQPCLVDLTLWTCPNHSTDNLLELSLELLSTCLSGQETTARFAVTWVGPCSLCLSCSLMSGVVSVSARTVLMSGPHVATLRYSSPEEDHLFRVDLLQ